ncbi:hypothetical protein EXIGLDRAFT_756105 [Exidia glandulosa HHB12029]|uniref:Exonuclease V n=1 Tax=Exidia glandulosa HHB12029 TaxID=1314781 RepID=A0A165BI71_EXIGL|nr:hypothetical protein EXIGLDRAFT_756105 [Exidia glandulosa HHB12029]
MADAATTSIEYEEDLAWDFTSSDLEFADPPPGGWQLEDEDDKDAGLSGNEEDAMPPRSALTAVKRAVKSPKALLKKKHFSVTDLVSVSWCELQVDYGLRQQRHILPVEKRAPTFVSREGKTLQVQQKVAVERSQRLEKGVTVHKKLEREIHPKEIIIRTTAVEESWTSRLLEMVAAMETLDAMDACREIPVFGFVQNDLVLGAIDEIVRKETSSPLGSAPSPRTALPPGQTTLDAAFTSPGGEMRKIPRKLYLIDNKTRASSGLPKPRDTMPSALQLMLYYRLLSDLLYPPLDVSGSRQPYDFAPIWKHVGANPTLPFSEKFQRELAKLGEVHDLAHVQCLNDVVNIWQRTVNVLRGTIKGLNSELEIVYRTRARTIREKEFEQEEGHAQPAAKRKRGTEMDGTPSKRRRGSRSSAPLDEDGEQLQRALELSLAPASPADDVDLQQAIAASLSIDHPIAASVGESPVLHEAPTLATSETSLQHLDTAKPDDPASRAGPSDASWRATPPHIKDDGPTSAPASSNPTAGRSSDEQEGLVLNEVQTGGELAGSQVDSVDDESPAAFVAVQDPSLNIFPASAEATVPPVGDADAADDSLASHATHPEQTDDTEEANVDMRVKAPPSEAASSSDESVRSEDSKGRERPSKHAVTSRTFSNTQIIGSKIIHYNGPILDKFLESALAFWHGEREPEGVVLEDIDRCWSCEYKDACEWRERKGLEHLQFAVGRRQAANQRGSNSG